MKTSNKLLLGLLILILLASTTLVGMAKYYQTQTMKSRTGGTGCCTNPMPGYWFSPTHIHTCTQTHNHPHSHT
jgi:hypothetical protein